MARYFLITGSDEICEVVGQEQLSKAVHDMFCCDDDLVSCDNGYFEAFKTCFGEGIDFEGWKEGLEDGWLNVEELPAQPRQIADLARELTALKLAATEQATQAEAVLKERTRERNALALSQGRLLGALRVLTEKFPILLAACGNPPSTVAANIYVKNARAAIAEATPQEEKNGKL